MSFGGDGNMGNQSGKSGGDVSGLSGAGSGAMAGDGFGAASASASGRNAYAEGTGLGAGGGAGSGAMAGQAGGDVTDNTSMGDINISS